MADIYTKKQRSYNMSKIHSFGTKPELKIKYLMKKLGFAYQPKRIFGKPDFADRRRQIAVFVDGCFWHGCPKHYIAPKQNKNFWVKKIKYNIKRSRQIGKELKKKGWKVIRIWECQLK